MAASFLVLFAGCVERQVWCSDDPAFRELCGKWTLVSVRTDAGPTESVSPYLVISRSRFDYEDEHGKTWGGTYDLDPSKSPPEIDVITTTHPEKTKQVIEGHHQKMLGIYKLEGDKLTLCLDLWGSDPLFTDENNVRPASFRKNLNPLSKNYGRFYTFVYQREPSSVPRPTLSVSPSPPPRQQDP